MRIGRRAGGGHADDAFTHAPPPTRRRRLVAPAGHRHQPVALRLVHEQQRVRVPEQLVEAEERGVDHLLEAGGGRDAGPELGEGGQRRWARSGHASEADVVAGGERSRRARGTRSTLRRANTSAMPVSAAISVDRATDRGRNLGPSSSVRSCRTSSL